MIGLDARSRKLHGMKDSRWTIFDKVQQYRQIISLEIKDNAVIEYQKAKIKRHEEKLIGDLRAEVRNKQDDLRNALEGNQRRVWSTLSDHGRIQRAFGRDPSDVVADHLHKENDLKRRKLDLIEYNKRKLMSRYKELVMKVSDMDHKLKFEKSGLKTDVEKKRQTLVLEIQNKSLTVLAARNIRNTYNSIIKLLLKDQIYCDCVLSCLRQDRVEQSEMLLSVTKMGQVVIEYTDDLKGECEVVEAGIVANMAVREKSLETYRMLIKNLEKGLSNLIPTGSQIFAEEMRKDSSMIIDPDVVLTRELDQMNELFRIIKDTVGVIDAEMVYPLMWNQQHKIEELMKRVVDMEQSKDRLKKDAINIDFYLELMKHIYNLDKIRYLERKRDLLRAIRKERQRKDEAQNKNNLIADTMFTLKLKLNHMRCLLKVVRDRNEHDDDSLSINDEGKETNIIIDFQAKKSLIGLVKRPLAFTKEPQNIFDDVKNKLSILKDVFQPDDTLTRKAEKFFNRNAVEMYIEEHTPQIDLLAGVIFESSSTPTNKSIKKESIRIVDDNTVDELEVAAAQVRARKKPGAVFRKYIREEQKRRKRNACAL